MKDVLAALRLAENPRDRVAGFRVAQLVPGIGPATASRILDRLASGDPAVALSGYTPPRTGAEWKDFAALFEALFRRVAAWPAEFEQVRRWYEPHLERLHEDAAVRAQDFPSRPITVVIGLPPGGGVDVSMRRYAEVVGRNIGQRLVIENRDRQQR